MTDNLASRAAFSDDPAERVRELESQLATLQRALYSRETIGTAKGILMARENCTPDEAFDVLRRASQRSNRKLADIAADIVLSNSREKAESRAPLRPSSDAPQSLPGVNGHWVLRADGHWLSSVTAMGSPRVWPSGSSRTATGIPRGGTSGWSGQGRDPLAGEGVGLADAVAFGAHRGNAKLVFVVSVRLDGRKAGLYSRSEKRVRRMHRPPVVGDLSSNEGRPV